MELIKVNYENGRPTVLARTLHEFLEVATPYDKWFPRMCEYGFIEGEDFSTFLSESTGGRPAKDAQLTIEAAKEICMLQRNEKGKQARQYFIQLEKEWNSPEAVMARAVQFANRTIEGLKQQNSELLGTVETLTEENQAMKPKAVFADAVSVSKTTILVGELSKILKQNGVEIGQNRLFAWLRENGYLICRKGTDFNMPTQKSMEMGLFEIKETTITHSDGHTTINKTPKVTGKGQQYFVNKFLANKDLS